MNRHFPNSKIDFGSFQLLAGRSGSWVEENVAGSSASERREMLQTAFPEASSMALAPPLFCENLRCETSFQEIWRHARSEKAFEVARIYRGRAPARRRRRRRRRMLAFFQHRCTLLNMYACTYTAYTREAKFVLWAESRAGIRLYGAVNKEHRRRPP